MTVTKVQASPGSVEASWLLRRLIRPWLASWRLVERALYAGHEYGIHVPSGKRVYMPWFADSGRFFELMKAAKASGEMIVSPDRCYVLYTFCQWAITTGGPLAECGVYNGGTAHLLAAMVAESSPRTQLHLFDSFQGMPTTSNPERDHHKPGDFAGPTLSQVKARLSEFANVTRFHPGFMPQTFDEVADIKDWAFVHLDVDIYPSMSDCCRWFWPRMRPGGVMVFDDYGYFPYRLAARAAIDEYFAEQERLPVALPTGQAMISKPC
jgi:O-methyltransferase